MVQINIVSGKMAGASTVARHFPFTIGREPSSALRVVDDGVWDRHCELRLDADHGLKVVFDERAPGRVNGESVREASFHNGDAIDLGAARLQLWFSPAQIAVHSLREKFTWALIALVTLAQFALLYGLLRGVD